MTRALICLTGYALAAWLAASLVTPERAGIVWQRAGWW